MGVHYLISFILLSCWCGVEVCAQHQKKCAWYALSDTLHISDSLSIIPQSIEVKNASLQVIPHQFVLAQNTIQILNKVHTDSVWVCFRTFPFRFSKSFYWKKAPEYDSLTGTPKDLLNVDSLYEHQNPLLEEKEEIFSSSTLQKNGNLSRGISVGNRQSVFVNSALNLQIDGNITEDMQLTAIISDQNVPFQPEGNTQQIQQLDRALLQLKTPDWTLSGGDIVLQHKEGHFLRFYKNMLGGSLDFDVGKKDSLYAQNKIAISAAKGQFHSYQMQVQDGVLGAYKITGAAQEPFISIIAGSEKVFLNGKLLKRGFNEDYVIDYNTAELTFTARILITRYSIVRIEFEYASQYYNRTIIALGNSTQYRKMQFSTYFYREQDNKKQPLLFKLDSTDVRILQNAGDSLQNAFSESISESNTYDENRILYTYKDTLWNGQPYKILIRAKATDSLFWSAIFSEIIGGSYVLAQNASNGKEYEWVGKGNGNFEPIRLLHAPNRKQLLMSRWQYNFNAQESLSAEITFSNQDKNLFSDLHRQDDKGFAYFIHYKNQGKPIKQSNYLYTSALSYEYTHKNFRPIDRYRDIEFERDWSSSTTLRQDKIFVAQLGVMQKKEQQNADSTQIEAFSYAQYSLAYRQKQSEVEGIQHRFSGGQTWKRWGAKTELFLMQGKKIEEKTHWWRVYNELFYTSKWAQVGYRFHTDRHQEGVDSSLYSAMYYNEHSFFVRKPQKKGFDFNIEYALRKDFIPQENQMKAFTYAKTLSLGVRKQFAKHQIECVLNQRQLEFLQTDTTQQHSLAGRLDWRGNFLQKTIYQELSISAATGQEPKREFVYVKVDAGQGTHTWRDDNADGKQQLQEFYEALNPDERLYVKFWTPTNQFLPAYTSDWVWRMNYQPLRKWQKGNRIQRYISRISLNTSLQSNRRLTQNNLLYRFIPFLEGNENLLLSMRQVWRSTLFYNRTQTKFGIELNFTSSHQKNLLTNGFEGRNNTEYRLQVRLMLHKNWSLRIPIQQSFYQNSSDFMENRNFSYEMRAYFPELVWQPSSFWRVECKAEWQNKNSALAHANSKGINLHFTLSQQNERMIQGKLRAVDIAFSGDKNTPLGYELLEALQAGKNLTWQFNAQQKVIKGLRLIASYEGRKSASQKAIHIGRIQLTAYF